MSYKNDHYLVIANKFSSASSKAKAELFELYDQIRDITVSGPTFGGTGFEGVSSFLMNMARLITPSAYMPLFGYSMNVPGTSYSTSISGGTGITAGGTSAFGLGNLGQFSAFPSGSAAPIYSGVGSISGQLTGLAADITGSSVDVTGYAASMVDWAPSAVSAGLGLYSGVGGKGSNLIMPMAGLVSGIGGIAASLAPYLGPLGLGVTVGSNLLQGYGGAVLAGYQNMAGKILSNADAIMTNKVKNIETVCKMLDTQGDVVKKMLKESIESDSKAIQNM